MIILIDIDNNNIRWSLFHKEQITPQKVIPYDSNAFKHGISQLMGIWTSKNLTPNRVLICSIANQDISLALNEAIVQNYELEAENLIANKSYKNLKNSHTKASSLDVNRWLKLIGAYEYTKNTSSAYCIIDCGSTITIDAVDNSGKHLGGFITPGIELMEQSLLSGTQQLAKQIKEKSLTSKINKLKKPTNASGFLANNSKHAMVGGIYYVVIAYIESIMADLDLIFNSKFQVFMTGCDAAKVLPMLESNYYDNLLSIEFEEDLVWHGMVSLI